jgi:hypothetical protein
MSAVSPYPVRRSGSVRGGQICLKLATFFEIPEGRCLSGVHRISQRQSPKGPGETAPPLRYSRPLMEKQ